MNTDKLVALSHRNLWIVLGLIVLFGACGIGVTALPDQGARIGRVMSLLPIAIIFAAAAMRRGWAGALAPVLDDELRQQSVHLAYRNGVFAALVAQPLLASATVLLAIPDPAAFMACFTVTLGAATVIASVLFYDR